MQAVRSMRAAARGGTTSASTRSDATVPHKDAAAPGFDKARGRILTMAGASGLPCWLDSFVGSALQELLEVLRAILANVSRRRWQLCKAASSCQS